jgi:iron complex outermembrane recepter protein
MAKGTRLLSCCAVVAMTGVMPGIATAQTTPADATKSSSSAEDRAAADDSSDIFVTATRRSESLADVPISITALTGAGLTNKGITNISDLSHQVSDITLSNGFNGSTNIAIRGVASLVGAATTGIYIDDTPIQSRFVGASQSSTNAYPVFFDIDRVEVLRGPQGTLFGAGSEGGTVRFISPQPSLTQLGLNARSEISSTQGGAASYEFGVAGNAPLVTDKLGLHLAGYYRQDGGYIDRVSFPGETITQKNINQQDSYLFRASLLWQPVENLSITPSVTWQKIHKDDDSSYSRNDSNPDDGHFNQILPFPQPSRDRFVLPALNLDYTLGGLHIINVTSFLDRTLRYDADYIATIGELLGQNFDRTLALGVSNPSNLVNTQKSFTEEFRIQSADSPGARLKWVAGFFYQNSRQAASQIVHIPNFDQITQTIFGLPSAAVFGRGLIQPGDIGYQALDRTRDRQIAGFGQIDYTLFPSLTVTAGVRVAHFSFDYSNTQDGPFNGGPSGSTGTTGITRVTPKFGVQWKPSKDTMLYGSVAQGVRQGGANAPVPATLCAADLSSFGLTEAPRQYKPDSVWSYEVGAKGKALDGAVDFDGSLFNVKWNSIQSVVQLGRCGFSFVGNLGSAVSRGADIHTTIRPVRNLSLDLGITYTDAHYSDTINAAASGLIIKAGSKLPIAPWQISVGLDYKLPSQTVANFSPYIRVNYTYNSKYTNGTGPGTISFDPLAEGRDAINQLNGRVGLTGNGVDISLFVNNILNASPIVGTVHQTVETNWYRDYTIRPRTFGFLVSYKY